MPAIPDLASRGLLRAPDFLKLWIGQSISAFGTQVTLLAVPILAAAALRVSPLEFGLLATIEFLPILILSLPAGVWVDRLRRRPILIAGDLGRAVCLLSIPLAYAFDVLTIWQLYVVVFSIGCLSAFFDVAYQSYLPSLVEPNQLVEGNARLELTRTTSQRLGPGLAGLLVGFVTAPFAIVVDAISYVVSALFIFAIRRRERADRPSPAAATDEIEAVTPSGPTVAAEAVAESLADDEAPAQQARSSVREEVRDGLRFVLGNRYLGSIAATTGSANLFSNIAFAILPVFFYRDLGLTPEVVGLIGGGFGAGALLGAVTAGRIPARIGIGKTIVGAAFLGAPLNLLVPLASRETALLLIGGGGFVSGWANVVYNVSQVSLRQAITPEPMLGRMNATMRFIVWGTIPVGQIVGGTIATLFGTVTAIWIGVIGGLFAFVPVLLSPVRSLKAIPDAEPEPKPA